MEKDIVKMPRSHGDVLTRMKSEYVGTAEDVNFMHVLVASQEASQFAQHGGEFSSTPNSDPADVFTSFSVTVATSATVPEEWPNADAFHENQSMAAAEKVDDSHFKISADISKLNKWVSDDPEQAVLGEFAWLLLAINTGESTVEGLYYNGIELDSSAVGEFGLGAGSFALWLKADQGTRTILVGKEDKTAAVTIEVVDTSKA